MSGTSPTPPTGSVRVAAGQTLFLQRRHRATPGSPGSSAPQSSPVSVRVLRSLCQYSKINGLIAAQNANLYFHGGLTNQAAVAFSYGISSVFGTVANSTSGTISVSGGAGVTFYGDVAQNGTLAVNTVGNTRAARSSWVRSAAAADSLAVATFSLRAASAPVIPSKSRSAATPILKVQPTR